jgi:hypothetical protein
VPIFTSWPRVAKPVPSAWPTPPEPRMPTFIWNASGDVD